MQPLQQLLLGIYGFFKRLGWLDSPWFQKLFLFAYFLYKKHLEDPFYGLTQRHPELFQGGHILDIGANIGYTAVMFSKAIAPGYQVYAFEPDVTNFRSLKDVLIAQGVADRVVPICAAVGDRDGAVELWHNESHHADHRIVTAAYKATGLADDRVSTVEMYSVDQFVRSQRIESAIALIKIDVQGYELPVCLGMQQTLTANPNAAIAIEYAPDSIAELGFQPEALVQFFYDRGYLIYLLHQQGTPEPVQAGAIERIVEQRGYVDLLCSQRPIEGKMR